MTEIIENQNEENLVESHNELVASKENIGEVHGETSEGGHEHTLYAEEIFHIGNFPITNSLLNTWLVLLIVIVLAISLKNKVKKVPGKLQNFFEIVIEQFLGIFDSVTGERKKSLKFFPFVFSFFLLILINNWLGLLPGVGSLYVNGVALFRGGTADLNTTLALAIIGVTASHIFGVVAIGIWNHFNKFVNIKALLDIPKKVKEDPSVLIVNPIKVFVGLIEIIGEAAKVASLSFRLFGNIFAGEVLLASMAAILAFGLPIPFMFLEVLVGVIQALIFSMLILAYLSMNTSAEEH